MKARKENAKEKDKAHSCLSEYRQSKPERDEAIKNKRKAQRANAKKTILIPTFPDTDKWREHKEGVARSFFLCFSCQTQTQAQHLQPEKKQFSMLFVCEPDAQAHGRSTRFFQLIFYF